MTTCSASPPPRVEAPAIAEPEASGECVEEEASQPRADAALERSGETKLPNGVLYIPSTFESKDGDYDLYIHFHGAPRVVLENAEIARLNAVVVVMNHGVGSAVYAEAYRDRHVYRALLERIDEAIKARGLAGAKVRRVAIGSWSAGFAAVAPILDVETPDAVLLVDSLHSAFSDAERRRPDAARLAPFVTLAKRAAAGTVLFEVTHSAAWTDAFASASETADVLIKAASTRREAAIGEPVHLEVDSAQGYLKRAKDRTLVQRSEASIGDFSVKGYEGGMPEDHLAQLIQIGATVFPKLRERWSAPVVAQARP